MKYLLTICSLILSFSVQSTLFAQEIEQENVETVLELSNINAIQLEVGASENVAIIRQLGNQNNATIFQNPAGMQSGNFVQIFQNGNRNSSIITQQGAGLRTESSQNGTSNSSNFASSGENINITASQSGSMNNINATVQNNTIWNKSLILDQNGSNNQINIEFLNGTILGSELLGTPFRITQSGSRQDLNLNFDNSNSPVNITQTPGSGGRGMQVNITTSAFPVN
ncbi:hypothetical protein [Belliella aquatica]|uniref:Curlin associated repeat-containing protein n=1 Tax=Belliella aquatica TaxID=1323734 RepID=A0ABQ1MEC8_9BACT|nr:hypothetical protein [Belliella aquatica]MCH7405145.1 hypothetical protein [Belliella aquatica]GGC39399.1 hypothetical protein GCM10010993_17700 [Belliella aquatica]